MGMVTRTLYGAGPVGEAGAWQSYKHVDIDCSGYPWTYLELNKCRLALARVSPAADAWCSMLSVQSQSGPG